MMKATHMQTCVHCRLLKIEYAACPHCKEAKRLKISPKAYKRKIDDALISQFIKYDPKYHPSPEKFRRI